MRTFKINRVKWEMGIVHMTWFILRSTTKKSIQKNNNKNKMTEACDLNNKSVTDVLKMNLSAFILKITVLKTTF